MPRKPKHTIAEIELVLEQFRKQPCPMPPWACDIIDRVLQNTINQRRASKDNPGRPATYPLTITQEDGEFMARCDAFPTLSAFGKTRTEALKEGRIVLKLLIEEYARQGLPLPKGEA